MVGIEAEGSDAGVKIELLKAISARKIEKSRDVLLEEVRHSDVKVSSEALKTVSVMKNLKVADLLEVLKRNVSHVGVLSG